MQCFGQRIIYVLQGLSRGMWLKETRTINTAVSGTLESANSDRIFLSLGSPWRRGAALTAPQSCDHTVPGSSLASESRQAYLPLPWSHGPTCSIHFGGRGGGVEKPFLPQVSSEFFGLTSPVMKRTLQFAICGSSCLSAKAQRWEKERRGQSEIRTTTPINPPTTY